MAPKNLIKHHLYLALYNDPALRLGYHWALITGPEDIHTIGASDTDHRIDKHHVVVDWPFFTPEYETTRISNISNEPGLLTLTRIAGIPFGVDKLTPVLRPPVHKAGEDAEAGAGTGGAPAAPESLAPTSRHKKNSLSREIRPDIMIASPVGYLATVKANQAEHLLSAGKSAPPPGTPLPTADPIVPDPKNPGDGTNASERWTRTAVAALRASYTVIDLPSWAVIQEKALEFTTVERFSGRTPRPEVGSAGGNKPWKAPVLWGLKGNDSDVTNDRVAPARKSSFSGGRFFAGFASGKKKNLGGYSGSMSPGLG